MKYCPTGGQPFALFAYSHAAEEGEFDLGGYAAIGGWLERVAAEPGHVAMG